MRKVVILLFILPIFSIYLKCEIYLSRIDSLMNAYVSTGRYNGTICIAKDNKILVNKGYGIYDIGKKIKSTRDINII